MRNIVISDIHGCFKTFKYALDTVSFNENADRLILLGDYVDRGKDSKKVLDFIRKLPTHHILLKGNHDEMAVLAAKNYDDPLYTEHWFWQGGRETLMSFGINYDNSILALRDFREKYYSYVQFLDKLPMSYAPEHLNYIFVHAGVDYSKPLTEQTSKELLWIREPFLHAKQGWAKRIIHGHTPTRLTHGSDDIHRTNTRIGIDGGCVFGGQLNVIIFDDDDRDLTFATYLIFPNMEGIA
jgi:serine/threonine protein phosphatase 1